MTGLVLRCLWGPCCPGTPPGHLLCLLSGVPVRLLSLPTSCPLLRACLPGAPASPRGGRLSRSHSTLGSGRSELSPLCPCTGMAGWQGLYLGAPCIPGRPAMPGTHGPGRAEVPSRCGSRLSRGAERGFGALTESSLHQACVFPVGFLSSIPKRLLPPPLHLAWESPALGL